MGRFEITKGRDGRYRFVLIAANGETVAVSEPYDSADSCADGIEKTKKAARAPVDDLVNGFEHRSGNRYEIYLDRSGEFRFRLRLKNGSILFHGEGYRSKASCRNGIASIGNNAPGAPVIEIIND